MASFPEYDQFDGIGLANLVRDGKISSGELCEEAIRRAEKLNPELNAIVTKTYEFARKSAAKVRTDAPFCGVPFLLKDAHHALKGFPLSYGSRLLRNFVPQYDAEIVRRFRNAGFVILGKTNTPEFKLGAVTEPKAFGPTRNPWNLDYSSAGSSGGSAAAVAARIVPAASGTDEGGSIRMPASYCGLFGFKPSRGRNPVGPNFTEEWDGMSHSHVLTRSVRDSAAVLDAVSGREDGSPYGVAAPSKPFSEEINSARKKLKIGYYVRAAYGRETHPECIKAMEEARRLLQSLGHDIEEMDPGYTEEEAAFNWITVMIGNAAAFIDSLIKIHGIARVRANLELQSYAIYKFGQRLKALDFVHAKCGWRQLGMLMDQHLQKYDMMLTPTFGDPPVPVGSQQPGRADRLGMKLICSPLFRLVQTSRKLTDSLLQQLVVNTMKGQRPFTMIANITGQPAMSVPLHQTESGLPCGVQFIGRYGDDAGVLRLAAQLEREHPWNGLKPQLLKDYSF